MLKGEVLRKVLRRMSKAGCLTCGRPSYFDKRPKDHGVGIGLWCLGCEQYEADCRCTPKGEDEPSHMV